MRSRDRLNRHAAAAGRASTRVHQSAGRRDSPSQPDRGSSGAADFVVHPSRPGHRQDLRRVTGGDFQFAVRRSPQNAKSEIVTCGRGFGGIARDHVLTKDDQRFFGPQREVQGAIGVNAAAEEKRGTAAEVGWIGEAQRPVAFSRSSVSRFDAASQPSRFTRSCEMSFSVYPSVRAM